MARRRYQVRLGDAVHEVELDDGGAVRIAGADVSVAAVNDREWRVTIGTSTHHVLAAGPPHAPWMWCDGIVYRPEVSDAARPARPRRDHAGSLAAPMPATVRAILVEAGDRVGRGDTLIVLEAMKMELPVKAPADGTVTRIACQAGELVQPGVPLVELA